MGKREHNPGGPLGAALLSYVAVFFDLKKIYRFVIGGKKGREEAREGGGMERAKREEEKPLESPLSPLGACGWINCGSLVKAADFTACSWAELPSTS